MARNKTERIERYIPLYLTDDENECVKRRTGELRELYGTNRAKLLRKIFIEIDEDQLIRILAYLDLLKEKEKILE